LLLLHLLLLLLLLRLVGLFLCCELQQQLLRAQLLHACCFCLHHFADVLQCSLVDVKGEVNTAAAAAATTTGHVNRIHTHLLRHL
jgi:hypothetical protein